MFQMTTAFIEKKAFDSLFIWTGYVCDKLDD